MHRSTCAAPGEWYLPEGFLTQSLDQDSDSEVTTGGANITESLQETYRDRLLDGLECNNRNSGLSIQEEEEDIFSETRQEILNLLATKYGFYLDQQEEEEQQFVRAALQLLKTGVPLENEDYYSKPPPPVRQNTLDLSVLKDDSASDDKVGEASGSEAEEDFPKKGLQARSNTLTEFKDLPGLQEEEQCTQPAFLEELQEGLRRRGLKWTLSTEEDLSPRNEEQSQTDTSENVVDTSQESEVIAPSEDAPCEEESGGQGDSIMHTLAHNFQL
ncbi:hypothetical protein E2C01_029136 [Portunus trituberculatus]|uniref:Uncharacterized protein n=1 Tax=Portunus trituberculatus TaxID=210409 RepID=A0A5B7EQP5_PORTR|nr:hypothetical protein [Portunus trituberculatus]